jgi:hypothetical protein
MPFCHNSLLHHRLRNNRAKWPWTESSKPMSLNKYFFLLSCLPQVFCHSDRKLTCTVSWHGLNFFFQKVWLWGVSDIFRWLSGCQKPGSSNGHMRHLLKTTPQNSFSELSMHIIPADSVRRISSWRHSETLSKMKTKQMKKIPFLWLPGFAGIPCRNSHSHPNFSYTDTMIISSLGAVTHTHTHTHTDYGEHPPTIGSSNAQCLPLKIFLIQHTL